jgi:hypothetical protein
LPNLCPICFVSTVMIAEAAESHLSAPCE